MSHLRALWHVQIILCKVYSTLNNYFRKVDFRLIVNLIAESCALSLSTTDENLCKLWCENEI